MKVLLLSYEFGSHVAGGVGQALNGVVEELRGLVALDVLRLHPGPAGMAADVYRCAATEPATRIARYFVRTLQGCIELIQRERYDVVHFLSLGSTQERLLCWLRQALPGVRTIYSVHSLAKHEAGTRRNPGSQLRSEQRMLETVTLIHVLNESSKGWLAACYPAVAAGKPVRVIPNGIHVGGVRRADVAFRARIMPRLKPNVFTVLCVSRWAHGKGLEHYIAAAAQLLRAGFEMQFVLAGRKLISWEKSWYLYVADIERRARGLGSRCLRLGWVTPAQRETLFALADVAVVPSELEYFPYSVLEPAAAGLPLVCSNLPCVAELLRAPEEYARFESRDSRDLANQLAALQAAPARAKRMAERAKAAVSARCDWKAIARDYADMYGQALMAPGG